MRHPTNVLWILLVRLLFLDPNLKSVVVAKSRDRISSLALPLSGGKIPTPVRKQTVNATRMSFKRFKRKNVKS
jgi:hypothetical protein